MSVSILKIAMKIYRKRYFAHSKFFTVNYNSQITKHSFKLKLVTTNELLTKNFYLFCSLKVPGDISKNSLF